MLLLAGLMWINGSGLSAAAVQCPLMTQSGHLPQVTAPRTELFFTSSITAYHNLGKVIHAHHFAWLVGGCGHRYRHASCIARVRTSYY
jgi:hypothetical protein